MTLFNYFDQDKSGHLDYKEFAQILTNTDASVVKKSQQFGSGMGYKQQPAAAGNINDILSKVRAKIISRGARGMVGLGKSFKIMDDNNSRSLDTDEF